MRANYFFIPDFGSFSANFNLLCSVYDVVIVCRHRLVGSLFQRLRDRVRLLSSHRRPSDVGCCKHCQQVDAAHKLYSAPTRSINFSAPSRSDNFVSLSFSQFRRATSKASFATTHIPHSSL
ncbi:hypothetical protein HC256_003328 [Beauveria bassiana]|nr:hypothetical protein HC256_003328 [Beauveria bassiana]